MRNTVDSKTQEQLTKLKQVPVDRIRGFITPLVNIPIGELSLKMSHRALYVLSSTLVQVREQTNKLADIFQKRELEIKKLIDKYEGDERTINSSIVVNDLKSILIDEEELERRMAEKPKQPHKCNDSSCKSESEHETKDSQNVEKSA